MTESQYNRTKIFVCFALLFFLAYGSAFYFEFGMHNDYWAGEYHASGRWFGHPETNIILLVGRPIQALLINVQFFFLSKIIHFQIFRLFTFFLILSLLWVLMRQMMDRYSMDPILSASMVFSLLALPATQMYVVWVSTFLIGPFTVLLAIISYLLLYKLQPLPEGALTPGNKTKTVYLVLSGTIFLAALMTYPPTSMFVFVLILVDVLFAELQLWPATLRRLVKAVLFYGLLMATYLLLTHFVILPHFLNIVDQSTKQWYQEYLGVYGMAVTYDWLSKPAYFVDISKVAWAGAWHLVSNQTAAIIIFCFVTMGCFLTFQSVARHALMNVENLGSSHTLPVTKWSLQKLLAVICLLFLANVPALIASSSLVGYRLLLPYTAMPIVISFWILHHWFSVVKQPSQQWIFRVLGMLLVVVPLCLTFVNISSVSRNNNLELNYVRQRLCSGEPNKPLDVLVIELPQSECLVGDNLKFWFRFMCFNSPGRVRGIIDMVASELGLGKISSIVCLTPKDKEVIEVPEEKRIIDMNQARVHRTGKPNNYRFVLRGSSSLELGTTITFGSGAPGQMFLIGGFSEPEDEHTWTNGEFSLVQFNLPPIASDLELKVRATPFAPTQLGSDQYVDVFFNDQKIARWDLLEKNHSGIYTAEIKQSLIKGNQPSKILLKFSARLSPEYLGMSPDKRLLGLAFRDIILKEKTKVELPLSQSESIEHLSK